MRALMTPVLLVAVAAVSTPAHAGKKAELKAYVAEFTAQVEAAYPSTVWALKDLPVKSGLTMGVPWIGPVAEVTLDGYKIEAKGGMESHGVGASGVWFSVRPYDSLEFKECEFDDGVWTIVFSGVGDSDGRDTKLRLPQKSTFAEVKPVLDQLISATDPLDGYADWSPEVKTAIQKRLVINGMNKRQAYFVVGEPTGSSVREEDGQKIETWSPRQTDGIRIGYAAGMSATGYPTELRFEDGVLVGVATTSTGGVSLD